MQDCGSVLSQVSFELRANLRVGSRKVHRVERRPYVQPTASHQHRNAPGGEQLVDPVPRQPLIGRHVGRVPEGDNVTDAKVRFKVELVQSTAIPPPAR